MRTNIDIDDDLLKQAMKASGLKTKKAVVEHALEQFVKEERARKALEDLRGIGWDGDLDAARRGFIPVSDR
jgi:Arc/MetJ family transcription regulator